MLSKVPSIGVGVRDQENDDGDAAIPALQGDSPIERLHVEQSHFCLDRNDGSAEYTLSVPCTLIPGDWHGHLRPPRSLRRQLVPETLEEARLWRIAHRIAIGVRTAVEP